MALIKCLALILSIIVVTEGIVKIGITLDESIDGDPLRKYIETTFPGELDPVFISSTWSEESNIPYNLKDVKCILDLSMNNEEASKLGDMLEIPVITNAPNTAPIGEFVVSMYPGFEKMNEVMVDVLNHWKITQVALLYDVKRSEQAANLQSLARESKIRMFLMPEINMDKEKSRTYAAGELKRSHLTDVVVLCDPKDISTIMDETIDFNMYEDKENTWLWFALDMDFKPRDDCISTLDGVVGFVPKLPDETEIERIQEFKQEIQAKEKKLHSTASNHWYANLHDMFVLASKTDPGPVHDDRKEPLRKLRQTKLDECTAKTDSNCALSGPVQFQDGARKVTAIKIVDIRKGRFKLNPLGEWSYTGKITTLEATNIKRVKGDGREKCRKKNTRTTMRNYTILVKTGDEPFVYINESLSENERFKGFCIDIVRKLASRMMFEYRFEIESGTGGVNENTSRWSGIIGELIDQKADMATGSLTITAEREKAVDFSKPFMDFTMALILRKPEEDEIDMFRFLDPFSPTVWLCTVMTVFAMTIFMYVVDYLSPYGNRKTAKESDEPGDEFSLYNSLWFATASMLQQGPDNTPKSPSGRLLAASFWFFVLLMISTYTANLAAFFTNKRPKTAISNLEDLSKQSKIKYGVFKGGQIHTFLKHSNDTVHKKMVAHMNRHNSFMNNSGRGVARARNGGFAYLTEEPILEYWNSRRPCNTMLVKHLLEAKSYGFALPKNSELTTNLSVNILKLREDGIMDELYQKWWKKKSQCSTTVKSIGLDSMKIRVESMAGVFIVLVSGVIISIVLVAVEVKCKWLIDLILDAGCDQCTDYYCEDDESYEYMEPAVEATTPCELKRVPDAYSNVQESKV